MNIALHGGEPIRKDFLPFFRPDVGEEEINEVIDTLKSGWITTGPKTKKFEQKFSEYTGAKHSIAVSSCTAALHLALDAIGVRPGDEVITVPYTFAATANTIVEMGATPVFVDVERDTLNMNPELIEDKITSKTKAIIPVHFAGHPADMDKIMKIAKKHGLYVIEDAAHATESVYKGQKIGVIGDITCFSFYATKNLCTAEGGAATTFNDEFAERMRIMSLHGISKDAWKRYGKEGSWYYEVIDCGYKYNFTDIQAAMGLHQLEKIEKNNEKRRKIAEKYNEFFSKFEECITPVTRDYIKHAWHLYALRLDFSKLTCDRKEFIEALAAENIGASVHFIPLHIQPFYVNKYGFKPSDFPVAFEEYEKEVSLPLFPGMKDEEVEDVCKAVEKLIGFYKKKISVAKKVDNEVIRNREQKAKEYVNNHEVLKKMKDVLSDDKFTELKDEAEVKAMEAVVESISIYYEDEAWNFIKDKIDSFFENYVSSVENAENF